MGQWLCGVTCVYSRMNGAIYGMILMQFACISGNPRINFAWIYFLP